MHLGIPTGSLALAFFSIMAVQSYAEQKITPVIDLQSRPLTPGLKLDDCSWPIHQIQILVDAKLDRGVLVLDGNKPEFDEFGGLEGGSLMSQVVGEEDTPLRVKFDCSIELIKEGPDAWRLYRLSSPKIQTPLRIATKRSIADGGPARLVVIGARGKVKAVVPCTRYGVAIP